MKSPGFLQREVGRYVDLLTPEVFCFSQEDGEEFEHFQDEEEFEGLDQEAPLSKGKQSEKPDLKITKVITFIF